MKKLLQVLLAIILFVAAGGIAAYLTTSLIIKSEDTVPVPDLIQKDVLHVLEVLSELGLNTKVRDVVYDPNTPENSVIRQDPEPGARIKKGREVKLVISKGPNQIPAPQLIGMSAPEAALMLEQQGFQAGWRSYCYSDQHRKDEVMAQSPMSGYVIQRAAVIDLLISSGAKPRAGKMPKLIGLHLAEAIREIEKSGFVLGQVENVYQADLPRQRVLAQEPAAGSHAWEKSRVNIRVNRQDAETMAESGQFRSSTAMIRHRLAPGLLRRHIRIQLSLPGISIDLFDQFVRPGEEVKAILPRMENAVVFLYEDDELMQAIACDE